MSSQAANVIDLNSYRQQRQAQQTADAAAIQPQPFQPLPIYAPAYLFGFWPTWVMAPVAIFGAGLPGATADD